MTLFPALMTETQYMQICFAFQNNFNSNYISLTYKQATYSLSKHLLSTQKSTTKYLACTFNITSDILQLYSSNYLLCYYDDDDYD